MENNDYVKVVRCKNCIFYRKYPDHRYGRGYIHTCACPQWWDREALEKPIWEKEIEPDAFCSYGEERDGEEVV